MLECRPHCLAYRATCLFQQDVRVNADNSELGIAETMEALIKSSGSWTEGGWVG
jgi:hypothetical protein